MKPPAPVMQIRSFSCGQYGSASFAICLSYSSAPPQFAGEPA